MAAATPSPLLNPPLKPRPARLPVQLPLQPTTAAEIAAEKKRKMSSSTTERLAAAVVTVSDSCSRGQRQDLSGNAVAQFLQKLHIDVIAREVVPDEALQIQNLLIRLSGEARLVVTTGGTGIAPRDVTPEATVAVCDRLVPGVAERMRGEGMKKNQFAALSRGVCGIRGRALILNLPGSPAGAVESLEAVAAMIPHAIDLLSGKTDHK